MHKLYLNSYEHFLQTVYTILYHQMPVMKYKDMFRQNPL